MHKFDIARETLEEILDKKVPFNIATKSILDKYSVPQEDRVLITGIVGCELRHHLLFKALIEEDLKEASEVNQASILLALANHHFYQKFDEQEVIALTFKATKIDKKVLEDFLNSHNDKNELIPAKYEKGTFEYLSLRYNCPVWLVKMFIKHYGRGLAFKVLQANTKPVVQSYNVQNEQSHPRRQGVQEPAAGQDAGALKVQVPGVLRGPFHLQQRKERQFHQSGVPHRQDPHDILHPEGFCGPSFERRLHRLVLPVQGVGGRPRAGVLPGGEQLPAGSVL